MPQQRFPRLSYARRAADLAYELSEWIPGYRQLAEAPNYRQKSRRAVRIADDRWVVLEDLAHELDEIALRIAALQT